MPISQEILLTQFRGFAGPLNQFGDSLDDNLLLTILSHATITYSKDSPLEKVSQITSPTQYMDVTTLPDWEAELSIVTSIYTNEVPPCQVAYTHLSDNYIQLADWSKSVNLHYTALHELDANVSTIPNIHSSAVIYLCLSELASTMSLRYEQGISQGVIRDMINYDTKAGELRKLSEVYYMKYKEELQQNLAAYASAARYKRPRIVPKRLLFHP